MLFPIPHTHVECDRCAGTGREIDQFHLAEDLRATRKKRNITAKAVAHHIGISQQYLNDLELGRRDWTGSMVRAYWAAIGRSGSEG